MSCWWQILPFYLKISTCSLVIRAWLRYLNRYYHSNIGISLRNSVWFSLWSLRRSKAERWPMTRLICSGFSVPGGESVVQNTTCAFTSCVPWISRDCDLIRSSVVFPVQRELDTVAYLNRFSPNHRDWIGLWLVLIGHKCLFGTRIDFSINRFITAIKVLSTTPRCCCYFQTGNFCCDIDCEISGSWSR